MTHEKLSKHGQKTFYYKYCTHAILTLVSTLKTFTFKLENVYELVKKEDLFCVWYLPVVELQGTNQVEERRGGPNPFWEKLCRGRLESRVQQQGGAYL